MTAPPTHGPPESDDDPAASSPEPSGDPVECEPTDWEPVITRPDPVTEEEREAWLAAPEGEDEAFDPEEYPDPDGPPPPGEDELTPQEVAEIREVTESEEQAAANAVRSGTTGALAAIAARAGRRGPGQPGSAAELIRRRPGPGCPPEGPARMPAGCEEFTAGELAYALAGHRGRAEDLLTVAAALEARLPGTRAALRDGIIRLDKAQIIAYATALLDPEEARRAEAMVPGRAGRLTPGGLRAAIARAVIDVAPGKARKRREEAARDARVQQWAEDSGNAALMGRELPPAEVLAADQRITAWARQLRAAGLDGDMDVLRARAYLDILLGKDSRPGQDGAGRQDGGGGRQDPRGCGPGPAGPDSPAAAPTAGGPHASAAPVGFAGRITLTIPLATLLGLADRPGEITGIGPIDPALARDLANAAAANPKTTWCVTVTDQEGHAIGHGCARPEPKNQRRYREKRHKPRPPDGRDPPREDRDGPGFAFTATGQHGPPGGYGTWALHTGTKADGPDLTVALDPITTSDCDHRFQATGHDPGIKLRHLAQVRHATCTSPICRRPAATCDFEHNTPHEAGGRTCLCNGGPKCRHDHRLKQHPRWQVDQLPDGTFRWTTPSGRQYTTEPTRYPI